jgi:peptide/nickel transport system permease protein
MGYQNVITGHWWPSIFPGLAMAITVFGFSLVGSSIEVLGDPARRRALAGELEMRRRARTGAGAKAVDHGRA